MKNRFELKGLIILVALAMCLPGVLGLGISPADKTLQFEPGKSVDVEFAIINSELNDLDIKLSASGDLANSVFFESDVIKVSPESYRIPLKISIKMPEELTPGMHVIFLKITPLLEGEQSAFSAYVSPMVPIKIRVPYPDKYAQVSLKVVSVDEGTPVPISLQFDNFGSEDISTAGGLIHIYDPAGTLKATLTAPEISVGENTFGKTEAVPAIVLARGLYAAQVNAYYDSVNVDFDNNFSIGVPVIEILEFAPLDLVAGEVNSVEFDAELFWNAPIKANAVLMMDGHEEEWSVIELEPGKKETFKGFFDATSIGEGEKTLTLRLVFDAQVKDYIFNVRVFPKGSIVGTRKSLYITVISVLAVVIALIIGAILFFRRRKKPEAKEELPSPEEESIDSKLIELEDHAREVAQEKDPNSSVEPEKDEEKMENEVPGQKTN